ncbi:MAG: hypothetical protein HKN17_00500 [Rhodothermales bacterium]|nr:hypothetical protein [Rhodothermales bacterium]
MERTSFNLRLRRSAGARAPGARASGARQGPGSVLLTVGLLIAALLSGCGPSGDFHVDTLEVDRLGWDSLRTAVSFVHDPAVGGPRSVAPDMVIAHLFNLRYDTLYAGPPGVIPVPDEELGDEERVLVEICGTFRKHTACEQYSFASSPKRSAARLEVEYPLEPGVIERGNYELSYSVERQEFEGEEWAPIDVSGRLTTWLEAYLENGESGHVRIPVERRRSRFSMDRTEHYRDFRFDVNSALMDTDSAAVIFDLFADLGPSPMHLASRRIVVRRKSEAERREEVGYLTELAAVQVLDRLKRFFGLRSAYVFINDWSYVALDRVYRVEMELHWQDAFRGDWSDLTGELVMRSDGRDGTFRYLRGSDSAERRWSSRIDSTIIRLDPVFLDNRPPTDEEENVQRTRSSRR